MKFIEGTSFNAQGGDGKRAARFTFSSVRGTTPVMGVTLRWVGEEESDQIAETRLRCYAHAMREREGYRRRFAEDARNRTAEFLLADVEGESVGTATSLALSMWVRGGCVPCQGVAWVGTVRTHRRQSPLARGVGAAGTDEKGETTPSVGRGVASQIMAETLRRAREREFVVSALMPFRASFYEHFGYGVVERRCEWTLPLAVLPEGDSSTLRFYASTDADALAACRQRVAEVGQCDIERPAEMWSTYHERAEEGFEVVDGPAGGPIRGWMSVVHQHIKGKDLLRVSESGYEDPRALLRQLRWLSSLRDQYATAALTLPADLPLNRLLRETQLPHRPVNHAHAAARPFTRMQIRVLDHKRFLGALRLPLTGEGDVVVAVHETEGDVSRFGIEAGGGRFEVSRTEQSPQFECRDVTWAAVASGDLSASMAVRLGLADCTDPRAPAVLDALSVGPAPFTHEYF